MCVGWGVKKSSMKKSRLKGRRMWATQRTYKDDGFSCHTTKADALYYSYKEDPKPILVAVIPLDDADRMISKARAAYTHNGSEFTHENMRAALVAIGVLPKQRKKGRK